MAKRQRKASSKLSDIHQKSDETIGVGDQLRQHRPEAGLDALESAESDFVDDWNPRTGEIYLGSQYFESMDGFTPSILAGSETQHKDALEAMNKAIKRVTTKGQIEHLFGENSDLKSRTDAARTFLGDT